MNKRKVAVFVEGQAEYVFVRDFCADGTIMILLFWE